jgi:acetyl-CoA synthetase
MTAAGATMPGRGAEAPVAWTPTPEAIERANVTRLMRRHGIGGLDELHERSLEPEWLWPAVIEDLGIELKRPYERLVDLADGPAHTRWFEGAELNLAAACLDRWAELDPRREALGWDTELGGHRRLDFSELTRLADGAAAALSSLGVGRGDTVGLFMPLAPETVAALHGCWKLGAIAVPIFSGFGADALARRLVDAGARVLVTVDGFQRRGSVVPAKAIADTALAQAPEVERVLVWRRLATPDLPWTEGRDVDWDDAVPADPPPATQPVPAEHPALLIYTSGSTGRPKGAVLTHAGMLLTIAKDAAYHVDLGRDDRLCWVTDLGWIMGAWEIVAAGSLGAYACMIEGAPASPPDRLWRLIDEHEISVVGVSPSLIRGLAAAGAAPGPEHHLSSLRILAATGEPWSPAAYDWLAAEVGGGRCPVINISGGSEVCGCLLAPTPVAELETCSLGGPALGMDVAVFGEDGQELGPDQVGELVCRRPWPGMTKSLWNDDERFIETYWSRFPGVWVHGDWASYDERGQWFLHGRSDDTLNVGGQRIGPAEAEAALTALDEVAEAATIAMPHPVKGEAMWCFVVPAGELPDEAELADVVAAALGKPFRPDRVIAVDDLPRTRSQKILRRVVRAVARGEDPGDLSSLENPEAIDRVAEAVAPR